MVNWSVWTGAFRPRVFLPWQRKIWDSVDSCCEARLRLKLNGCYLAWPTICSSCTTKLKNDAWEQVLWFRLVFRQDYSRIQMNIGKYQGVPITLFSTPGWFCTDSKEYHKFWTIFAYKRRRCLNSAYFAVLRQRQNWNAWTNMSITN